MRREYYTEPLIHLYQGDCRNMAELLDNSVDCCITSPPYWGLRVYKGIPDLVWGGDKNCEHEWGNTIPNPMRKSGKHGPNSSIGDKEAQHEVRINSNQGQCCSKCQAWKGQLGLEPDPSLYIEHLVSIFREVKRVLKPTGICWLNIGDSYAGSNSGKGDYREKKGLQKDIYDWEHPQANAGKWDKWRRDKEGIDKGTSLSGIPIAEGLKPKDLCLIPFRLAIEAQKDGWWIRSVICWEKKNPMPESVSGWRWERHKIKVKDSKRDPNKSNVQGDSRHNPESAAEYQDCLGCEKCLPNGRLVLRKGSWRPTESHEYILMLTKSDEYFADGESVREIADYDGRKDTFFKGSIKSPEGYALGKPQSFHTRGHERWPYQVNGLPSRNLRSVWTFPTQSYKFAHFATYPDELVKRCVLASTPEAGSCSKCGKPWVRVIEEKGTRVTEAMKVAGCNKDGKYQGKDIKDYQGIQSPSDTKRRVLESMSKIKETTDWRPSCKCNAPVRPSLVLDPFAGSGTTGAVAKRLGRKAILYELSEDYCKLAKRRIERETAPIF